MDTAADDAPPPKSPSQVNDEARAHMVLVDHLENFVSEFACNLERFEQVFGRDALTTSQRLLFEKFKALFEPDPDARAKFRAQFAEFVKDEFQDCRQRQRLGGQ